MKKTLLAALLATTIASPALGEEHLYMNVESLRRDDWRITAMVKVTNNTSTPYDSIYVHCAFFDRAKTAIQDSIGVVSAIWPRETAFVSVDAVDNRSAIRSTECRIGLTVPAR